VATDLANDTLSPTDMPIQYIRREENALILNTRSTVALIIAGIDRSAWIGVDMTGDALFEDLLNGQLQRNGLTEAGIDFVNGPLGRIYLP